MKKLFSLFFCFIIVFSFVSCKSDTQNNSATKTAEFKNIGLDYTFTVPLDLGCIIDDEKQTVWLYDEKGDVSDWQILITLTPATKEEFDNFHLNQRGFIKSQTAETILEGRYLYKYDTDTEVSKIYGIAEYSDEYGCIVYLRAKTNIDTEIAKEMFDTAKITKEK